MRPYKALPDAFGRKLKAGDLVAYVYGKYSTLHSGKVARFTPKRIVVNELYKDGKLSKYDIHRTEDQVTILTGDVKLSAEDENTAQFPVNNNDYPEDYWRHCVAMQETTLGHRAWVTLKQMEAERERAT